MRRLVSTAGLLVALLALSGAGEDAGLAPRADGGVLSDGGAPPQVPDAGPKKSDDQAVVDDLELLENLDLLEKLDALDVDAKP